MANHETEKPRESSLEEKVASGELFFLMNQPARTESQILDDIHSVRVHDSTLEQAKDTFGEENIVVSNALDNTGEAKGVQGMVGVYVTREAWEQAQLRE
jgi:hypothetical protein